MALTPTRRRNGKMMISVNVKHTIDFGALVLVVAAELWYDHHDIYDRLVTKTETEKAVRMFFGIKGDDGLDDVRERLMDDEDEALGWAEVQVDRLYPQLRGT